MSAPRRGDLPVDPDVAPEDLRRRLDRVRHFGRGSLAVLADRWDVLLVIGLGGSVGSLARWGVGQALPVAPGTFPLGTFLINVIGSLALGVLMVFVTDVWSSTRYVRPFLGVGVLGGFTTFSTYTLDVRSLLVARDVGLAGGYLFGTLVVGLLAVWAGITITRGALAVVGKRRWRGVAARTSAGQR